MMKQMNAMLEVAEMKENLLRKHFEALTEPQRIVADYVATMGAMVKVCNGVSDDDNDNLRLLALGKWSTPQALPSQYKHGAMKQCFKNAGLLAVEKGLEYREGIALAIIPTHHAWCVDADGRVIDPTWRVGDEYHDPASMAYLGVPFSHREVFHSLTTSGSCLFNWRRI